MKFFHDLDINKVTRLDNKVGFLTLQNNIDKMINDFANSLLIRYFLANNLNKSIKYQTIISIDTHTKYRTIDAFPFIENIAIILPKGLTIIFNNTVLPKSMTDFSQLNIIAVTKDNVNDIRMTKIMQLTGYVSEEKFPEMNNKYNHT